MRWKTALLFALLGLLAAGPCPAAPILLGVGAQLIGADAEIDQLVCVDPDTAATTPIGGLGADTQGGLTYNPNNGLLYSVSTDTDLLFTISPATGMKTAVGSLGGNYLMHGLAYDSRRDVLYAMQHYLGNSELYTVSMTTGLATPVAFTGVPGAAGLAYNAAADVLYTAAVFARTLYTVDPVSGTSTVVGVYNQGIDIQSLAYDDVLGLYGVDTDLDGSVADVLWRLDTTTGVPTWVGELGTFNGLGLAFIDQQDDDDGDAPEPASAALLSLGVLALVLKRR